MLPAYRGSHDAIPHAPAWGPGAGDADDATTTTTHTQQRRDPSGSRLFRRIPGKDYGAGGAHKPHHSDDSSSSAPTQPHAGPLIRARVRLPSLPAQSLPEQQREPLRISSVTCAPNMSHVGPLMRAPALQSAHRLFNPHFSPPIRTPALQSARGPANTSLGRPTHTPDSGFTCDIAGYRSQ